MQVAVVVVDILGRKVRAVQPLVAMVEITYQPHRKLDNPTPEAVVVVVLGTIAVKRLARVALAS
jgi:hypothetical protein